MHKDDARHDKQVHQSLSPEGLKQRAAYAKRARELAGALDHDAEVLENVQEGTIPTAGGQRQHVAVGFRCLPKTYERICGTWKAYTGNGLVMGARLQFMFAVEQTAYWAKRVTITPAPDGPTFARRRADQLRRIFRGTYPEFAGELTDNECARALDAWGNPRGRPKKGAKHEPKWTVLQEIVARIGLGGVTADGLKRQWRDHNPLRPRSTRKK